MKTMLWSAALAALVVPSAARAQAWSSSAPTLTVTAQVLEVRQAFMEDVVHLSFGSEGIVAGTTKTVRPADEDAARGSGAKLDIRFNTGTRVTISGTQLTADVDGTTYSINPTYACAIALDRTGEGLEEFAGECSAGYEWTGAGVTGMVTRTVMVGATLAAEETARAPAGTYTGTLTVTLSASSS